MAISLRVPMALSLSSSSPSTPSLKRRNFSVDNCSKIKLPPLPPRDPFLSNLASVAANNPDILLNRREDDGTPPLLAYTDAYMGSAAMRGGRGGARTRKRTPPDLASMLFDLRIVYIGMPLVPAVTELIIAELMLLQWLDPKAPIYMYINSTGTTRDDGEVIAHETEGFAIYDAMMQLKNEIYTLNLACAVGQACLLLAAGTKVKRFTMPLARATIHQNRIFDQSQSGLMTANDAFITAKEVLKDRDTLVKLYARHTGHTQEEIAKLFHRGPFHMSPAAAIEFGVVDKIFRGQKDWKSTATV